MTVARDVVSGAGDVAVGASARRMISLDALRGFDMLWIIGGDDIVYSLAGISHAGLFWFLAYELSHAEWEGFRFYDLIFPLFLFMVGISTVLSVGKIVEEGGKRAVYWRIFRRFALLCFWAFIYAGGFEQEKLNFAGVLQRIAYCYLITALLVCNLRLRGLILVCVGILIGYWALLTFVPVPDIHRTTYEINVNWSNYLDRNYLPGEREARGWRNEGMLSTLPAVSTCLLGVFAGFLLKSKSVPPERKVWYLLGGGCVLVALGYVWGLQFPIIKKIWTSSYVLVAGGYSCLLLGAFYYVIDLRGYRRWATPFVWLGANALTMYLISGIVISHEITGKLIGGALKRGLHPYDTAAQTIVAIGLLFILARFLYRRKIFLRV